MNRTDIQYKKDHVNIDEKHIIEHNKHMKNVR